jgi:hypothetical protein
MNGRYVWDVHLHMTSIGTSHVAHGDVGRGGKDSLNLVPGIYVIHM